MAALPVERALERVLHGQGPALDEEQVRQCRVAKHPGKDIDEIGVMRGVDVGVRGLVRGRLGEQRHELGIAGDIWRVDAQRRRGEERVQVQVALAGFSIDDPGTGAEVQVQNDMEAVRQNVTRQTAPDVVVAGHGSLSAWAGHVGRTSRECCAL